MVAARANPEISRPGGFAPVNANRLLLCPYFILLSPHAPAEPPFPAMLPGV
jgi:hypothetical protein